MKHASDRFETLGKTLPKVQSWGISNPTKISTIVWRLDIIKNFCFAKCVTRYLDDFYVILPSA